MPSMPFRYLLGGLLLLVLLSSGTAEAQRRRTRTRRTPRTTTTAPADAPAPPPDPFADEPADASATPSTTTTASSTSSTSTTTATATSSTTPPPPAAAVPAPSTTAAAPPPPAASSADLADVGPTPPDLSPLRAEYSSLMDDMVAARELVATLGEDLFQTRVAITVQDRAGDDQSLASFALELDGTPVFHTEGEIEGGGDGRQVYEGALAPGPHVLTVAMEQRASQDSEYRYVQRDTYRFIVVRDRRTEIEIVLEDDSDIAQHFAHDGEGRYDVHTRVRVATRALQ